MSNVTDSHELGPLEMKVLGLFQACEPTSVTTIQERLRKAGDDLAYTTVMTVLSRLHEKRVLTRRRDGRRFLYSVSEDASKRASGIVARIHRTLFKTVRMGPIVALLEEQDVSTEELRELRRLVDAKLKERKR